MEGGIWREGERERERGKETRVRKKEHDTFFSVRPKL